MTFVIQRESFVDIMYELPDLFAAQYEEAVTDKDGLVESADYDRYCKLEDLNVLHCLTARVQGELVGYFINMVVYHLHHKGVKTSSSDLIYVLPEWRKGSGIGLALLTTGIDEMRKLGVRKMYVVAKKNTGLCRILKRFKFRATEETHSLFIGE